MDADQLKFIIQSYLHNWGIPKQSHRWKDYEMGKRNLRTIRLNSEQYVTALVVLSEWVGV